MGGKYNINNRLKGYGYFIFNRKELTKFYSECLIKIGVVSYGVFLVRITCAI